ncbi:MAG: hypothetical protein H0W70_00825 [Actinobacteria bacterium]|nr:hypothetical protein [Actinomycetota bacterium]
MATRRRVLGLTAALITLAGACSSAPGGSERESGPAWVDAWQAAPSGVVPHRCATSSAVSAFPKNAARPQTLRLSIRPSVAGDAVRVRLSNRLSDTALEVRHVTVGQHEDGATAASGTLRDVLFASSRAVSVPPRGDTLSDATVIAVTPDRLVTISIAVASGGPLTWHADGPALAYATRPGRGDVSTAAAASAFTERLPSAAVVTGLQVHTPRPTKAIVALGDSFTDAGTIAPTDRWLDIIGERLKRRGVTRALLNAGITCNRLLHSSPGGGPDASTRFAADVLNKEGASHVVLFEGTNDLVSGAQSDALIAAIGELAARARSAGLRAIGATVFPRNGAPPNERAQRQALNRWIRTTDALDGYLDFDRVIRDPADPDRINPAYNADGVHVNARGRRAMGAGVNLSLFSNPRNAAAGL